MSFGIAAGAAIGGGLSLIGASMTSSAAQDAAQTQANAADRSANLQNAQWQQTQGNLKPYLNLGSSAINPLLLAMGYRPSSSAPAETRDQIYARLLPQFTTASSSGNPPSLQDLGIGAGYKSATWGYDPQAQKWGYQVTYNGGGDAGNDQTQWAYAPNYTPGGGSTVDSAGLNAAVDAAYNAQSSNPFSNLELDPNNILNQTFTAPTAAEAQATPGYQFTLDQGLKSVQNSAAARGLGTSGAALKGAASYATGLADSTYNDVFNRALTTFNTNYGSAANRVNRLSALVGNGQNAAATNGSLGAQSMSSIGNTLTSGANALASGQVGGANALSSGLSSIGNNALLYGMTQNNAGGGGTNMNSVVAAANRSSDPIGYMAAALG